MSGRTESPVPLPATNVLSGTHRGARVRRAGAGATLGLLALVVLFALPSVSASSVVTIGPPWNGQFWSAGGGGDGNYNDQQGTSSYSTAGYMSTQFTQSVNDAGWTNSQARWTSWLTAYSPNFQVASTGTYYVSMIVSSYSVLATYTTGMYTWGTCPTSIWVHAYVGFNVEDETSHEAVFPSDVGGVIYDATASGCTPTLNSNGGNMVTASPEATFTAGQLYTIEWYIGVHTQTTMPSCWDCDDYANTGTWESATVSSFQLVTA